MSYRSNQQRRNVGGGRFGGGGRRDGGDGGKGRELCKFYMENRCEKESKCRFSHFVLKLGGVESHRGAVKDVVLWSEKQQVFTCSQDQTVKLSDCANHWKEVTSIPFTESAKKNSSTEGVTCLFLSDNWLFVGFEAEVPTLFPDKVRVGSIRAWNLLNAQQQFDFHLHEHSQPFAASHSILSIVVSNGIVFSGSSDGLIRLWRFDQNKFVCLQTLVEDSHVRGVTKLKIITTQHQTTLLASCSIDGSIKIWDMATFKCLHTINATTSPKGAHTDAVMDLELWVNSGEHFLISAGLDKRVSVWNLNDFSNVFEESIEYQITAVCGMQDAASQPILLLGTTDGYIVVKELPSFKYKTLLTGHVNYGHREAIRRLLIGPQNTFFSCGNDKKMIAWQITGNVADIKHH